MGHATKSRVARLSAAPVALAMLLSLAGCGDDDASVTPTPTPTPTAAPSPTPTPTPTPATASAACTVQPVEALGGGADQAQNLCAPALATDSTSTLLVWNKPDQYAGVVDYQVLQDGKVIGTAEANAAASSPAQPYRAAFVAADTARFHVTTRAHNFAVTGLSPSTLYSFTVRAMFADSHMGAESAPALVQTTPAPSVIDVTAAKYGAKGDGTTLNTAAIQAAINDVPAGGTVRLPAGTFKSGALFLKSNMTLEIAAGATLLGSDKAEDYPLDKGYVLYAYADQNAAANKRPPSLLNALATARDAGTFQNIRIVGKGTIDGNGWKRQATAQITDEGGQVLPQYVASSNSKVGTDGILAADQVAKARAADPTLSLADAYSNRRSSLVTLRGVHGVYIAGVTIANPAYHGIMNLTSENVTLNGVIHHTFDANNGDGVEFGNSKNIIVVNNVVDTGDDCVNFASGQGAAAATLPSQSGAWIFNNYFRRGHGAVVIGSHTGGIIERILAEDNVMFHTDVGLRMKSTPPTGGGGRAIVFRDNAMRDMEVNPFVFTLSYTAGAVGFTPAPLNAPAFFSNIRVTNVSSDNAGFAAVAAITNDAVKAGNADGYVETWNRALAFSNVRFNGYKPVVIDHLADSTFLDVTVTNATAKPFWVFTNSPNVVLLGSTNGN